MTTVFSSRSRRIRKSKFDEIEIENDAFLLVKRGEMSTSIICEYSRRDLDAILDGNFKEADSTSFWRELPRDHVPEGVPKNVRFSLRFVAQSFDVFLLRFRSANRTARCRTRRSVFCVRTF